MIIESPNGVTLAIKAGDHVVSLSNQNLEHLVNELATITKDWPDIA